MNPATVTTTIEARPAPTPGQYAAARRYTEKHAPDLVEAIFGGDR